MGDDSKLAKILREAPREKIAISIVEGGIRREREFNIRHLLDHFDSIPEGIKGLLNGAIGSKSFRFTGAEVEKVKRLRKAKKAEQAAKGPAAATEAQVIGILSAIEQGSGSLSNSKANSGPDLTGNAQAPLPKTRRHGTTLEPMNLHSRHRAALPKAAAPAPKPVSSGNGNLDIDKKTIALETFGNDKKTIVPETPAPAISTAPLAEGPNRGALSQSQAKHETGRLPTRVTAHFQIPGPAGNRNEILLQTFTQTEIEAITRTLMGVANSAGRTLGRVVKSDTILAYFRFLKGYFLGAGTADSDELNSLEPDAMRKMVERAKEELSNKGFGGLTPLGAQRLESFMEQKHIAPPSPKQPQRQPQTHRKTANKL